MVKKIFGAIALATFSMSIFAQKIEEVTLTVSGDGETKKEATEIALRSAIEQAFGVFVSANTTILDDELVKDEIATVSSGNIKKYDEIATATLPNGNTTVTLKAVVSVSKLITYAQSKGSTAEFAGATFGMNMKLKELNRANEEKAIENMIAQLKSLVPTMFDYKLELGEPVVNAKGDYDIPAKVIVIFNDNTEKANKILLNTLSSLSLSKKEIEEYQRVREKIFGIHIGNFISVEAGGYWHVKNAQFKKPVEKNAILQIYGQSQLGSFIKGYENTQLIFYCRSPKTAEYLSNFPSPRRKRYPDEYYSNFIRKIFYDGVNNFKIIDNLGELSTVLISSTSQPIIGCDSYVDVIKWIYEEEEKEIRRPASFHGTSIDGGSALIIPHLYKKNLAMQNGDYVCYILNVTMTIPKDDIMKYNNFTISNKEK